MSKATRNNKDLEAARPVNRRKRRIAIAGLMSVALFVVAISMTGIVLALSNTSMASDSTVASTKAVTQDDSSAVSIDKKEVVYSKLSAEGDVTGIYVVNLFESDQKLAVSDPGEYESVDNLSTQQVLECKNGQVDFNMDPGTFSYQGTLKPSTALPWKVDVSYTLDGKPISAESIAGKAGEVEIEIDVTANGGKLSTFTDNYLMQITATIDNEAMTGLEAKDGSTAINGNSTVITYMLLPGSNGSYKISGKTDAFHFDGLQIAAVPLSLALDFDISASSSSLGDINELQSAIQQLNEGASTLSESSDSIEENLKTLNQVDLQLAIVSSILYGYFTQMANELSGMIDNLASLSYGLSALAQGSTSYLEGLKAGAAQVAVSESDIVAAETAYQTALQTINGKIEAGVEVTPDDIAALNSSVETLRQVYSAAGAYNALQGAIEGYGEIDTNLQQMSGALADSMANSDALKENVSALAENYSSFNEALAMAFDGVSKLSEGYSEFNAGLAEFATGANKLGDATANLDSQLIAGIRNEIERRLNPSFKMHSFVYPSNENVSQVQFVYMTESINLPVAEEEPAPEPEETLWDRITKLFS